MDAERVSAGKREIARSEIIGIYVTRLRPPDLTQTTLRDIPRSAARRGRAGSTAKGGAVPAGSACRSDPGTGGMRRNKSAGVTRASAVTSPPSGAPAPGSDAHAAHALVQHMRVNHHG